MVAKKSPSAFLNRICRIGFAEINKLKDKDYRIKRLK